MNNLLDRRDLQRQRGEEEYSYSFKIAAIKGDLLKRQIEALNGDYEYEEHRGIALSVIASEIEFIDDFFKSKHDGYTPLDLYRKTGWKDACLSIARKISSETKELRGDQLATSTQERAIELGIKTRLRLPPALSTIKRKILPNLYPAGAY